MIELPFLELITGAAAMALLFVIFGIRAPAEGQGGCGSCAGNCDTCTLETEEWV